MSSHLLVCFVAAAESADDLERQLRVATSRLPTVPGCRGATLYRDKSVPEKLVLLEEWVDQAAHAAHLSRYVEGQEWKSIAAKLAQQPEARWLHAVDCSAVV